MSEAVHGSAVPRGQGAPPGSHFTRLFPHLPPCDVGEDAVAALAALLRERATPGSANNGDVAAGYTYLAQFIDHDITFDPTSQLHRDNDPRALENFRTARLDLDALYGSGPADQPFLYDWRTPAHHGVKLLIGRNPAGAGYAADDLPRNEQQRALVGDPRNDEHAIISQLHLLFARFHNRVVDRLAGGGQHPTSAKLLAEARRTVRWHYQWIVVHDFLPRVAGPDVVASVLPGPDVEPGVSAAVVDLALYHWQDAPAIPVEFSAAAYRFGHSMVRRSYVVSPRHPEPAPILPAPGAPPDSRHLGGLRRLRESLEIDWSLFFGSGDDRMQSLCIDDCLAEPLFHLPVQHKPLALLNLRRGQALGLPSGQDVAHVLGQTPLTPAQLFPEQQPAQHAAALLRATPLWFYLLREADVLGDGGHHLGPIGGRIVTEVLAGLLRGDPDSYLSRRPSWTPELADPATPDCFTMEDLVRFALTE